MSTEQFKKHRALFEGFWGSEETAQEIINSLSEEDVNNLSSDEIYRLVDEFVEMGDSPHAADRDEIAQIIMDRMGVYNDEENLEIDLNKHGIDPEGEYEDEVDYGDGMHDRENEDPEVYMPSSKWQYESVELTGVVAEVLNEHVVEDKYSFKKKDPKEEAERQKGIEREKKDWEDYKKTPKDGEKAKVETDEALDPKAARLAAIKKAAKKVAPPVDDIDDEDEFAAPERIVDVGDKEDYEDYNKSNEIDFNEIGVDIEDFNDRDDFGGWR